MEIEILCECEACKQLEGEVNTSAVLTTIPPQYGYKCRKCGHVGYILCSEYAQKTITVTKFEPKVESNSAGSENINGYVPYTPTPLETQNYGCPHRLPCGICRLTDKECSKMSLNYWPTVTWTTDLRDENNSTRSTGYTVTAQNGADTKKG